MGEGTAGKVLIPAVEQKKSYVWEQCDVVVSSLDTAKRSPHRETVLSIQYDVVIIDEAHKLKNNKQITSLSAA